MKKKGKVVKVFEDYEVFILFESWELRTIKGDALGESGELQIIKNLLQIESPRKTGYIRVSDWIPESLAGHVRPLAGACLGSSLSSV
jgi:hypothetical protein